MNKVITNSEISFGQSIRLIRGIIVLLLCASMFSQFLKCYDNLENKKPARYDKKLSTNPNGPVHYLSLRSEL